MVGFHVRKSLKRVHAARHDLITLQLGDMMKKEWFKAIPLVILIIIVGALISYKASVDVQMEKERQVRELYRHPDLIPEIHEVGYHYVEETLMVEDWPVYLVQVSKTNLSDEYDVRLFNIYVNIESEYVYWELG